MIYNRNIIKQIIAIKILNLKLFKSEDSLYLSENINYNFENIKKVLGLLNGLKYIYFNNQY